MDFKLDSILGKKDKNRTPAQNTTPESIELHRIFRDMLENGLDSVVMEVSSQGLKLNRVAGVDFDYGIFTNLSPDHIGPDEHDSSERIPSILQSPVQLRSSSDGQAWRCQIRGLKH